MKKRIAIIASLLIVTVTIATLFINPRFIKRVIAMRNKNESTLVEMGKLYFPEDMQVFSTEKQLNDIDSVLSTLSKMVVWVESTKCAVCELDFLYNLNEIPKYCLDSLGGKVSIMVIISTKNDETDSLINELKNSNYSFPIYIDKKNEFGEINPSVAPTTGFFYGTFPFIKSNHSGDIISVVYVNGDGTYEGVLSSAKESLKDIYNMMP